MAKEEKLYKGKALGSVTQVEGSRDLPIAEDMDIPESHPHHKLAVMVESIVDCFPVVDILEALREAILRSAGSAAEIIKEAISEYKSA